MKVFRGCLYGRSKQGWWQVWSNWWMWPEEQQHSLVSAQPASAFLLGSAGCRGRREGLPLMTRITIMMMTMMMSMTKIDKKAKVFLYQCWWRNLSWRILKALFTVVCNTTWVDSLLKNILIKSNKYIFDFLWICKSTPMIQSARLVKSLALYARFPCIQGNLLLSPALIQCLWIAREWAHPSPLSPHCCLVPAFILIRRGCLYIM